MRVLPRLEGWSIELVLCDLPYGVTDSRRDIPVPLDRLWAQYERILAPSGVVVLFVQQPFATRLIATAPQRWFRYEWIWDKRSVTGFQWANQRPMRRHESVLVFSPSRPAYYPQGLRPVERTRKPRARRPSECYSRIARQGGRQQFTGYPQSILTYARERGARPFQKPVALLSYLIRTYTLPGASVLDNTMGTGSTGVACIDTDRQFIGIERDAATFRIAEARIADAIAAAITGREAAPGD